MKIKKLEWWDRGGHSVARTPFGMYDACDDGWWEAMLSGHSAAYKSGRTADKSRASAKLACQADFERRVRECVEEEVCGWRRKVGMTRELQYNSSCGNSSAHRPRNFCPYCGNPIKLEDPK